MHPCLWSWHASSLVSLPMIVRLFALCAKSLLERCGCNFTASRRRYFALGEGHASHRNRPGGAACMKSATSRSHLDCVPADRRQHLSRVTKKLRSRRRSAGSLPCPSLPTGTPCARNGHRRLWGGTCSVGVRIETDGHRQNRRHIRMIRKFTHALQNHRQNRICTCTAERAE